MRPHTVYVCGNSEAANRPQREGPRQRLPLAVGDVEEPDDGEDVYQRDVGGHPPVDAPLLNKFKSALEHVRRFPVNKGVRDLFTGM